MINKDLEIIKSNISSALNSCKRAGMKNLILYLQDESVSDYFKAPASTQYHGNHEGGLIVHSWNVFDLLVKKNDQYRSMFDYDTIAICGLLHDVCKVNFYKMHSEEATKPQLDYLTKLYGGKLPSIPGAWNKEFASKLIEFKIKGGEKPEYTPGKYIIEDTFPCGHGEKSVIMLQKFIELTIEEVLAIRFHMGSFETGVVEGLLKYSFNAAIEKSVLVTMLITADMEASNLLERRTK